MTYTVIRDYVAGVVKDVLDSVRDQPRHRWLADPDRLVRQIADRVASGLSDEDHTEFRRLGNRGLAREILRQEGEA